MRLFIINNGDTLNQVIRTTVDIDGKSLLLYVKLRWLKKVNKWYMSLNDEQGNVLVRNVPLLAGNTFPTANLLRQFAYKMIGGAYVKTLVEKTSTVEPGKNNLGPEKEFELFWSDTLAE